MYAIVNSLDCYLILQYEDPDKSDDCPYWGEFGDATHFTTASEALQAAFELGLVYQKRFGSPAPYTLELVHLETEQRLVVGEVL